MEINPLWLLLPLLLFIFLGHPVSYVLGALGLFFGLLMWQHDFLMVVYLRTMSIAQSFIWVCVPLFIFMGYILERSGIADRLYQAIHVNLGKVRGGLGVATILLSSILGAVIGVIGASVTTVSVVCLNPMLKRGYDRRLAAGVVLAGGGLGEFVPPSLLLIIYATWADTSVGRMFYAAFMPSLILAVLFCTYVLVRCRLNPNLGPPIPVEETAIPVGKKVRMLTSSMLPILLLILAVLGTILVGIATPTEAAAFGALGSVIIAAANRSLTWSMFFQACYNTARITSMTFLIAGAALIYSSAFTIAGAPVILEASLQRLGIGPWGMLFLMQFVIFILGFFLDWIPILLLVTPITVPLATKAGFDPVWVGTIICINLMTGCMTPPFGYSLFYLKAVAPPEVTMSDIIWSAVPFVVLMYLGMGLVILFPQLALWLPNLAFGHY